MGLIEILLLGIGLAMDAFTVAICKGLAIKKLSWKETIIIAEYFGVFQAIMPIIGYLLGSSFANLITKFDHWIALALLLLIGGNMIKDSFEKDKEEKNDKIDLKTMFPLALATSIDALAVGITFAFFEINLVLAVFIIGIITFITSLFGVRLGNKFGCKYQKIAEITGGIILILLGIKIVLEHTGIF